MLFIKDKSEKALYMNLVSYCNIISEKALVLPPVKKKLDSVLVKERFFRNASYAI